MLNAIMIDLETLATKMNSVVTSIGAVVFDPRGYEKADISYSDFLPVQQQLDAGRLVDYASLRFWILQTGGARKANFSDKIAEVSEAKVLNESLLAFNDFVSGVALALNVEQNALELWSNGPHLMRVSYVRYTRLEILIFHLRIMLDEIFGRLRVLHTQRLGEFL